MSKTVTGKHLEGIGDLVVLAPLKEGFIEAFEAVTFETRLRLTAKALFKGRSTVREYLLERPFADVPDRIQSLESFRVAIVDSNPKRVMIVATFDRPWEPYMRLIWDPLGPFLDLLLCNCEGYVPAQGNPCDEYLGWVRDHLVDSNFFYASTGLTVDDVQYLTQIERLQRDGDTGIDIACAQTRAVSPDDRAKEVRARDRYETLEVALEALVVLYRLADYFPDDDPAQKYILLSAAKGLLKGWDEAVPEQLKPAYETQLAWYGQPLPTRAAPVERLTYDPAQVQGGIVTSYDSRDVRTTHGCLLLLGIEDPAKARQAIAWLLPAITTETSDPSWPYRANIAFTARGLANIGLSETELARLPKEFLEGMEARGGMIGDVRGSHPRRWTLPPRNWPRPTPDEPHRPPVEVAEIDIVIEMRAVSPSTAHDATDSDHPLNWAVRMAHDGAALSGLGLLGVESMYRAGSGGHFGLADGISQPIAENKTTPPTSHDHVARGEVLWGYVNDRGFEGAGDPPPDPNPYLDNGSFGAIRKLSQDVEHFEALLAANSGRPGQPDRETLLKKLIGRDSKGTPTLPGLPPRANNFKYEGDRQGVHCPFQAHIRRANPRTDNHGRRPPRIVRRGMSYGPAWHDAPKAARGLIFIAWNASLAEQYEVVQRWQNGGNATGVASTQSDPLMGVASAGDPRTFRFIHDNSVHRMKIEEPPVRLQWGTYVFAPSLPALRLMASGTAAAADPEAARGQRIIETLLALEKTDAAAAKLRWKAVLEDFSAKDPNEDRDNQAVWAAIRAHHGGVLRTAQGVLVGDKALAATVLSSDDARSEPQLSMCTQQHRLKSSIGPIFLGLDSGPEYDAKSSATNAAIMAVSEAEAFTCANEQASKQLKDLLDRAALLHPKKLRRTKFDLRAQFVTPVLAEVCDKWFGIPDGVHVAKGGWDWKPANQRMPRCPGDFMAPSRHTFYPDPTPTVVRHGQVQGKALTARVTAKYAAMTGTPKESIIAAMSKAFPDPAELASNVVGIMLGFLPPTDALLRGTLYDWLENRSLWRVQRALAAETELTGHDRASAVLREPLMRAMQARPAPDLIYRTATTAGRLGDIMVAPGEQIIVGTGSATVGNLPGGGLDVFPIFGGHRTPDGRHPTHACPGYGFAMGTMLGMLSALLDAGRIEALPAPLIIRLTDFTALPAAALLQPGDAASPSPRTPAVPGPGALMP